MLNVEIRMETENDHITPINIASALIESRYFKPEELDEIAEHLRSYTMRIRRQERNN